MRMGREESKTADTEPSNGNQVTIVSCGDLLGISMLHEFQDSLKQALASGLTVEIDASAVKRIDAAGMQLLCSFVCDAIASGQEIRWCRPSQALATSVRLLGLQNLLVFPPMNLKQIVNQIEQFLEK
jgi:ABC-type transporter Mla MlaB component